MTECTRDLSANDLQCMAYSIGKRRREDYEHHARAVLKLTDEQIQRLAVSNRVSRDFALECLRHRGIRSQP